MSAYTTHVVGRRYYLRTASAVMACHSYNNAEPAGNDYWFEASWAPRWGLKVLTIRECISVAPKGKTYYENGPGVRVWLRWREGEGDLPAAILETLGVDEESLADSGSVVEVHARVQVTFDPYRAKLREKST